MRLKLERKMDMNKVRDVAIIAGCYVGIFGAGWLLGKFVATPAIERLTGSDE